MTQETLESDPAAQVGAGKASSPSHNDSRPMCDLIMKGGITSGVVYPRAVCRLARRYRIKKLGGASVGAIAAAFAAAAEAAPVEVPPDQPKVPQVGAALHGADVEAAPSEQEAKGVSQPTGYARLYTVPDELGPYLGLLFQPLPSTRTAYDLMTTWLKPEMVPRPRDSTGQRLPPVATPLKRVTGGRKAIAITNRAAATWVKVVSAAPLVFSLILLVTLAPLILAGVGTDPGQWPWLVASAIVWVLTGLVVATLTAAVVLLRRTVNAMAENGFGLCDGHTRDPSVNHLPLTDWMSKTIDEIAGLAITSPIDGSRPGPLTFKQLWGHSASETRAALRAKEAAGGVVTANDWRAFDPAVDLMVMVTNLTFRRPYAFPFTGKEHFYFCEACWAAYFPDTVIRHLVGCTSEESETIPASVDGSGEEKVAMQCPQHTDKRVRLLPDAADLPVVVAARLSLSFPCLISAVPLHCVDYSRKLGERKLIRTWFSDGGIASNFPMHFFDVPWPRRPTFGIDLQPEHPDFANEWVWRPSAEDKAPPFPRSHELKSVVGFVTSMVRTMQNWADTTQITLPGFRDRVVEVRVDSTQGGLNLQMTDETIMLLASRGEDAAVALDAFDLDLHQWVRYRSAMSSLSEVLDKMADRYTSVPPDGDGYQEFLRRYGPNAAAFRHVDLAAVTADAAATAALMRLAQSWTALNYPLNAPELPDPRPQLRPTPQL